MTAKDFRTMAWAKLKGKWGLAALTMLIYAVISGVCSLPSAYKQIAIISTLLNFFIGAPLSFGFAIFILKLVDGVPVKCEILFDGFKMYGKALLVELLVNLFTALWALLLIIPGIIKSYSYSMTRYIAFERPDLSANEARHESMRIMVGHKWRLFCLDFSFIGWILLSILTLGVLFFWIIPYIQAAHAEFYRQLVPLASQQDEPPLDEVQPAE